MDYFNDENNKSNLLSIFNYDKYNNFKYSLNKIKLCCDLKLILPLDINENEPITKLLNKSYYLSIIQKKQKEITKIFYYHRSNINEILFNSKENIDIDINKISLKLSFLFYLCLIIEEEPDKINYQYSIEYIEEINDYIENKINELLKQPYKLIILSKLLFILIYNFRGFNDKYKDKLEEITNKIKVIFTNNIIKEIDVCNIKDIENKRIDIIYINIINKLIKSNKLEDYEYSENIFDQIHLEFIDITKTMFDQLYEILNEYKDNIKISKIEDLYNDKIINFYYILFKYILKYSFYIYQIPILIDNKNAIIKIIKKLNPFKYKYNNNERLEYILKFFIDSEYYYHKYLKEDITTYRNKNESSLLMPYYNLNSNKFFFV